ncbi:MAG: hypothetical protein IJO32_07810 [Bacilli bacterium]|nr:hypothetical protein [Bacilli bacterium]
MEDLVLISIKTKYANQIFDGTKIYEYRRKSIGEKNCNKKIFVYSSEKEKTIVGYIIVEKILEGSVDYILEVTNNKNNSEIINYFSGCDKGYALKISKAVKYEKPLSLEEIKKHDKKFVVPQFYRYIKQNEYIYNKLKI